MTSENLKPVESAHQDARTFRLSQIGLLLTNREGAVIYRDAGVARLLGFPDDQAPGTDELLDRIQLADQISFAEAVQRALAQGHWQGEAAGVSAENLAVLLEVDVRRVDAGEAGEIGAVVVLRDASRERMMEQRVLESNQMELMEKLSRGMVHDFRNLLTVISAHAELVRLMPENPVDEEIERIVETCEKATTLTRRLSDITRRLPPEIEDLDVKELLGELGAVVTKAMPPQVSLNLPEHTDGLPPIRADHPTLLRALVHLLLNAADAMPEGGPVTIGAERVQIREEDLEGHPTNVPGVYVVLSIADQGHGLSPSAQHHLFEPFFTTKKNGTGLGLYAVRAALVGMGGEISIYTETGFGTCVRVYLPAAYPGGAEDRESSGTAEKALTVLVVDDEPEIRQVAVRILESDGHKVLSAGDGREALEIFRKRARDIDAVLLDVVLPGMGGEDVRREILRVKPDTFVVPMSGFPRRVARQILGDDLPVFLAKPFTRADLQAVLAAAR